MVSASAAAVFGVILYRMSMTVALHFAGEVERTFFIKKNEEFRKQTDYISIVFIHTESAHAGALVPVSLHLP